MPVVKIAILEKDVITTSENEPKPFALIILKSRTVLDEPTGTGLIAVTDVGVIVSVTTAELIYNAGGMVGLSFRLYAEAAGHTDKDIHTHTGFTHSFAGLIRFIVHVAANPVDRLVVLNLIL